MNFSKSLYYVNHSDQFNVNINMSLLIILFYSKGQYYSPYSYKYDYYSFIHLIFVFNDLKFCFIQNRLQGLVKNVL